MWGGHPRSGGEGGRLPCVTEMQILPNVDHVLRIDYYWSETTPCGSSRIFMRYTGNPATASDVGAFLNVVTTSAGIRFPPVLNAARSVAAIRISDLTSKTAPVAESTTPIVGTRVGTPLPLNCAVHIHFKILRRYRGGKPRISLPWLDEPDTTDGRNWNSTPLNDAGTAFTAHVNEIASTVGNITVTDHVSVGYYHDFTVHTDPQTGRARNVPTLLATPNVDKVVQMIPKPMMGSSRRRLRAHTAAP